VEQLFARGAISAFGKDKPVGYSVTGKILDLEVVQKTDLDGKPQFWQDGNPFNQLVVTISTALRENAEDDGKRRVYVPWYGANKKAMEAAVRAVGKQFPEVGGVLTAKHERMEPSSQKGYNDVKIFAYAYQPPNPAAALFDSAAGTPQGQTTYQAPPAQQHAQPPLPSGYNGGVVGYMPTPQQQIVAPAVDPNAAWGQGAYASPPPAPASAPVDVSAVAGIPAAGSGASDPRIVAILAMKRSGMGEEAIAAAFPDFPRAALAAVLGMSA
jgi:hypothetical protein